MTTAGGHSLEFGDGSGVPAAARFSFQLALARPMLGEPYMNGDLATKRGTVAASIIMTIGGGRVAMSRIIVISTAVFVRSS